MKITILSIGILGAILFFLSVYSFITSGKHFRHFAYSFLAIAIATFALVIIKNLGEQFGKSKNQEEGSKQKIS